MERENFLLNFKNSSARMATVNAKTYDWRNGRKNRDYDEEEIKRIISNSSIEAKQRLSETYFSTNGYYKQIILHYASLLKYTGILVPHANNGTINSPSTKKRYNEAINFIDKMKLPILFTNCALKALIYGTYYGVIVAAGRRDVKIIDLPVSYCKSDVKDLDGNDLIEFNVSYFDTIIDESERRKVLRSYPDYISKYYLSWRRGKQPTSSLLLPPDIGICFSFLDGSPIFLSVIPSFLQYQDAIDTDKKKNEEEIKKIIVQKIPHLNDGTLLFEPEEAEEIHIGSVQMLKGNENTSVLTTYADVDAITSKTSNDNTSTTLEKMRQNIYSSAGVSGEIFASTNSATIDTSLKNDTAMMMVLANKFSAFITDLINSLFGNSSLIFKYSILPITYHNDEKFADTSFKLASSGYSFLLPAVALGISQRELGDLKDLENDVLGLAEKLKPLMSSYTQNGNQGDEGGRPTKDETEKVEKTVKNEEVDNNGKQSN